MSNTVRKYPRTMQAAFGPYTSNDLQPMPEPMHPHDRIVIKASALALTALLLSLFIWG
jgi:hypothetical protein